MPYTRIKKLDNPLIFRGKTFQFIDFSFDLPKAKDICKVYGNRYDIDCRIFTVDVKGSYLGKSLAYAVYSTWARKHKK